MKKIILGVSGSISAYKAAEILREFQKKGWSVKVVMTENATEFISPITFLALSGEKVIVDQFKDLEYGLEHIRLCDEAEALLVAPATANIIAKFAHGIADDFLSSLYLACKKPVFVAPAMNEGMLLHPATQRNLEILKKDGVHIIEPEEGHLACEEHGKGRLTEPAKIVFEVLSALGKEMKGLKVLVTAGATREFMDSVRFISNPSSGKQGIAIAEEAAYMGADVTLLLSSSSKEKTLVKTERFETLEDLRAGIKKHDFDILFMAAAVGDFRPSRRYEGKIRRGKNITLELESTPDLLREIAPNKKSGQIIVAFAAETDDLLEKGKKKLFEKGADLIFVNPVGRGRGFESDTNQGYLIFRDGNIKELPESSKRDIARKIIEATISIVRG